MKDGQETGSRAPRHVPFAHRPARHHERSDGGKAAGEATIFATTAGGQVVYSTNVRVSQNITTIDRMLAVIPVMIYQIRRFRMQEAGR